VVVLRPLTNGDDQLSDAFINQVANLQEIVDEDRKHYERTPNRQVYWTKYYFSFHVDMLIPPSQKFYVPDFQASGK
jgi:hypothetical protein